jgi:hypothetical protein
MTMHMLPVYFSTTSTKKRKQKKSKKQQQTDAAHAKFLKKMGYKGPVVQRSEPAAHNGVVAGSNPAGPTKRSVAQPGSASALGAEGRKFESCRSDQFYNSSSAKKDEKVYSGERKLLGIATMHKSNMVPVFSTEDAEALAKMRR